MLGKIQKPARVGTLAMVAFAGAICFSSPALAGSSTFSLGIEGFQDKFKETDNNVTGTTDGGSVTGYFSHPIGNRYFVALDGRVSYGTDDFTSPDGDVSGIPQWELDVRSRVGFTFPIWNGQMSPYIGLGWRFTDNQGKGFTTDQGYEDFDVTQSQFYIPIGASYVHGFGDGWSVAPQLEGDIMIYGDAQSHLTNVVNGGPAPNGVCSMGCTNTQFLGTASNDQYWGFGGRGEIMVGKSFDSYSIQAGPFFRYWYIPASDKFPYQVLSGGPGGGTPTGAINEYGLPKSSDLQVGIGLRLLFQ